LKKIFFLLSLLFISFINSDELLIKTSSGITQGYKNNKVIIWEDIPYAKPPINDLRWRAPRKISDNSSIIQPKTGNFCIQRTSGFGGSSDFSDELISGSEDCLYLDIFKPAKKNKEKLPVMVWIHGGGNTSGLKDIYDFSKLVKRHNVIIVRINYRLGPFGWFTHPAIQGLQDGIDKTSNFGTLDIIASLEWVKENINLFGGNQDNVTIFGESAGGHNVLSLLVSKHAKGLFHKAISMSGYTESILPDQAYKQIQDSFSSNHTSWSIANRIIEDKYDNKSQDDFSKAELKEILLNLSGQDFYEYYFNRKNFEEIPLLTNDGIVIPKIGLKEALSKKEFVNNVPTIAGSNRDEVKFWLAFSDYFVELDNSVGSSLFDIPKVLIKDKNAYEAFNFYRSSAWKVRGVDEPLNSLRIAGNKNLYSYRFDWDDQRKFIIADFSQLIGASHALEIPLLAGDATLVGGSPISNFIYPKGISKFFTSRNMMLFWSNFAKTGDPGFSSNKIQWLPFFEENQSKRSFMIIDNKKNLQMAKDNLSLQTLTEDLYLDKRLSEIEKCVVLFQMSTFVGNDEYDKNIKNYNGDCDRKSSERFIIENASSIDYD
tara:strand:+ start:1023 stop:2819 length:1797 start_codon:yes stop_codon:yes gene_type:complete